ncbi:MAG: hypothetical protein AAGD32_14190 [Planctomycetota bacterium]
MRNTLKLSACLTLALLGVASCIAVAQESPKTSTRPAPAVYQPDRVEASLLSHVLRQWLPSGDDAIGQTVFVSLGPDAGDPSAVFLGRFDDLNLDLRPGSQARRPKVGERESKNRFRGVEDPETGKRVYIHHVSVKDWINETKARVSFTRYGGPLASDGLTAIYEFRDDQWQLVEIESSWFS